ncbi:MAG: hypothetical protein KBS64_00470 [Treponema sp.]|nr:hypothetical protein [Candidatus Treponema equi]
MMKKLFAGLVSLFVGASALFAQVTVDPSDDFYSQAFIWHSRGVVSRIPPVRPYPLQNVKAILDEVLENGNEEDKAVAAECYERLTGKKLYVYLDVDGYLKYEKIDKDGTSDSELAKNVYICPGIQGDLAPFDGTDKASFGYSMGITVAPHPESECLPNYTNPTHDAVFDPSELGPCKMYLDVNDIIAYGNEDLYVQGGIYRSGYGNYLGQGLVLNDTRFHSTNLSLTWMKGRLYYTQMLSMLGATRSYNGDISTLDSGKSLGFHAIGYEVCDWFDFSFYEAAVIGERFDLCTLLPVPYMISEELTGAGDGVFMGVTFNVKPAQGWLWATDVLVDDFPINEFLKFNLDSKYRIAARTGIIWTPEASMVKKVSLTYTAITPYTYSHWEYDPLEKGSRITPTTINRQNYTNNGIKIGSQYEPNTDAVELSVDLKPVDRLKLNIHGAFSRHGNICESITDEEAEEYLSSEAGTYATDGSIYTHSMFSNDGKNGKHVDTAWNHLNFLSQDHIETTVRFGADGEYLLLKNDRGSSVSLRAGMDFEYIHNYGVGNEMFPGGIIDAFEEDAVKKAKLDSVRKAWEDGLCDKLNFYFNLGVSIRY